MTKPGTESSQEESQIKKTLNEVLDYFKQYFRNPVQSIRKSPDWDWTTIIIVLSVISVATAILSGLFSRSVTSLLGNIVFYPLVNVLSLALVTGIFFYAFQYLYKMTPDFRKLYVVVFLAAIPAIILRALSPLEIPVSIIGVLAASFLMSVGFIENFFLPRKGVLKLMGAFFGVFFVFWMYSVISVSHEKESVKVNVTPESLDILQKELTGK